MRIEITPLRAAAPVGRLLQPRPRAKRPAGALWAIVTLTLLALVMVVVALWFAAVVYVSEPMVDPMRTPPRHAPSEAAQ